MKSFFRNEEFLQKLRSCELVKNARKINFSQRKISSHPKTTVTEENDFVFFFWKVLGMGGKTYKKVVLQNFEIWMVVKNLEKMKFAKEKIWEICRMIEDFFSSRTSRRRSGRVRQRWPWISPFRGPAHLQVCRLPSVISERTSRRTQHELQPVLAW